jgi:VWFA-related protein
MHLRINRIFPYSGGLYRQNHGARRTLSWLGLAVVAASLTTCALAQQAAPGAAPATSQQPAVVTVPGPSLEVDRDPAPSPDPDPPMQSVQGGQTPVLGSIVRSQAGKYTLHEDAYEVRLNASVIDQTGKAIQTLDKDAFHVYEDGVAQTVASFRHEDLPVSLGILIDSSGSMYDKRTAVDEASLDLIKLSNPADEAFLVDFSWEAFIDQDFTSSIDKLRQGLSYIKSSGGTAIYDALVASADYLSKNAKHPKQVLLVVTDGEDNASSATLEQAIRRIQDFDGPVIYCIGLLFGDDSNKSESRHARRVLETLAEQTGGVAYFPKSVKEVDGIARQVAEDIRTQYSIAYHSTKSPALGGYRQVHVEAKAKGYSKLSVRTRTGYYPRVAKPTDANTSSVK